MLADTVAAAPTVAHHLRLFGLSASSAPTPQSRADVSVSSAPGTGALATVEALGRRPMSVLLQPDARLLATFGLTVIGDDPGPAVVHFPNLNHRPWGRATSVHPVQTYQCAEPHEVIATDRQGRPCWVALRRNDGDVLIVGTNLGGDLVRYRQGDPARAAQRTDGPMWGIPGERPIYLFDGQTAPGDEHERPADWWAIALAETIATRLQQPLPPLLPHGAPGAIVVTGDDDQAHLEKYDEQRVLLGDLPVTYFLHPLTRHTPPTLAAMMSRHTVELGLHPDALDQPQRYTERFREQAEWFHTLTGERATMVRNHGFLNDGYWGHLPIWLEQDVRVSANLPGVDGRILNGSLLPARVAWDGELTSHWSILTPIGDGVRFALGMDGPQSARCISDLAVRIEQSGLPGVMVLNLHPQNVGDTRHMHAALHDVVARGFVAMTLSQCVDWFDARDRALDGTA